MVKINGIAIIMYHPGVATADPRSNTMQLRYSDMVVWVHMCRLASICKRTKLIKSFKLKETSNLFWFTECWDISASYFKHNLH